MEEPDEPMAWREPTIDKSFLTARGSKDWFVQEAGVVMAWRTALTEDNQDETDPRGDEINEEIGEMELYTTWSEKTNVQSDEYVTCTEVMYVVDEQLKKMM